MVPITIITLISYRHSHNFSCGSSNDIDQICIQNCRSGYLWANISYKSTLNKEILPCRDESTAACWCPCGSSARQSQSAQRAAVEHHQWVVTRIVS